MTLKSTLSIADQDSHEYEKGTTESGSLVVIISVAVATWESYNFDRGSGLTVIVLTVGIGSGLTMTVLTVVISMISIVLSFLYCSTIAL